MQTAIEWFWNEIAEVLPFTVDSTTAIKMYDKLQQAKEMEKQQIIDAAERWKGTDFAEKYYAETYGSKGSDDINPLTSNHVDYQNHSNLSDNFNQFSLYEHKETIATADTPTSFQTEISDEEIEKAGEFIFENEGKNIYNHYNTVPSWVEGAKWYREQIKSKSK